MVDTNNTKDTKDTIGVWITASDYGKPKEKPKREKAAGGRTTYKYCRNCFCENKLSVITCKQCGNTNFATRRPR